MGARRSHAKRLLVHGYYYEWCSTICGKHFSELDLNRTESFALVRGPTQHGRGSVSCPECLTILNSRAEGAK